MDFPTYQYHQHTQFDAESSDHSYKLVQSIPLPLPALAMPDILGVCQLPYQCDFEDLPNTDKRLLLDPKP